MAESKKWSERPLDPAYKPSVGLRNVGSYQVSGHPYVTGSTVANGAEHHVKFPFVSKSVTIIASGSSADPLLWVGFRPIQEGATDTKVATGKHYITLDSHGDSMTFDVKCAEVFIHAKKANSGFELYASLTNIPTGSMYTLSGEGIDKLGDT